MPGQRPWEVIANYESHELVCGRYQAKHDKQPSASHSREIAASFIQARHYYGAAAKADRAIKPLLLYYGVVSMSRGLVLFLTHTQQGLQELSQTRGHGLSPKNWRTVTSLSNPDINNLVIEVNGSGVVVDLIRATNNRNLLRGGSSGVNVKDELGQVSAKSILNFGEMLARLPDAIDQFSRWQTPRCAQYSFVKIPKSEEVKITVPRFATYIDEDLVVEIVGRDHCELVSVDANNIVVKTLQKGEVAGFVTDRVLDRNFGIGDLYLTQPYSSGVNLAKIVQLFSISYVLSMLVRYHPGFWMDLVHQRINDAALPTIFRVIDCLEIVFPQIVVDFLEE